MGKPDIINWADSRGLLSQPVQTNAEELSSRYWAGLDLDSGLLKRSTLKLDQNHLDLTVRSVKNHIGDLAIAALTESEADPQIGLGVFQSHTLPYLHRNTRRETTLVRARVLFDIPNGQFSIQAPARVMTMDDISQLPLGLLEELILSTRPSDSLRLWLNYNSRHKNDLSAESKASILVGIGKLIEIPPPDGSTTDL
jgi:hypothetical protein